MKSLAILGSLAIGAWVFASMVTKGEKNMSLRERVVQVAESQVGHAGDWSVYTQGVASGAPTTAAWCGIFALWVLHNAGLAKDWIWSWGKGFAYRLPMTTAPKPGDIAYIDQPYQHHAIVVRVDDDLVTTVDGNQEGDTVKERVRPKQDFSAFYSIEPLVKGPVEV